MSADTVRVKVHAGWGVSHNGKAYSGCAVLDLVSRPIEAPCVGCRGHLAPSFGGERAIAQVTTELTTWDKADSLGMGGRCPSAHAARCRVGDR
jgi:hypothetical protein